MRCSDLLTMGGFLEKMLRLQTEEDIKMVKVQYQQSDKTNIVEWCLSSAVCEENEAINLSIVLVWKYYVENIEM